MAKENPASLYGLSYRLINSRKFLKEFEKRYHQAGGNDALILEVVEGVGTDIDSALEKLSRVVHTGETFTLRLKNIT